MAFLASKPSVANTFHFVIGRIEDTSAVSVAFLAVLTFGYKDKHMF